MSGSSNINLIKTDNDIPEYLISFENEYRNISLFALFGVVVVGVITLISFIIIQIQYRKLVSERNTINSQLETLKSKESLYLLTKNRIKIVNNVLKDPITPATYLRQAMSVAPLPKLRSIMLTDQSKIQTQYVVDNVVDAQIISNSMSDLFQSDQVKNITLNNFSITKNGVTMTFEYIPVKR